MDSLKYYMLTILIIGVAVLISRRKKEQHKFDFVDPNMPHYDWIYEDNFFDQKAINKLEEILKQNKVWIILDDTGIESAGEQVPFGHPDCDHPYMIPKENKTFCALPHRIDVAMHYLKIGGFDNNMESYEKMASRIMTFRHKFFPKVNESELKSIYGNKFIENARKLCSMNKQKTYDIDNLETGLFQFDTIIMLPGQELPMHLDIPYFWNANRKTVPHWLLVIMKRSGLFEDQFIPQVQGVSWLSKHQYEKSEEESLINGGNFYFYPYSDKKDQDNFVISKSQYNSAIIVDGTQVIHGVERYKQNNAPPNIEKNQRYQMYYQKVNDSWNVYDEHDAYIQSYSHKDLRISLVWRTHCFKDQAEKEKYKNQKIEELLTGEQVIQVFKEDMIKRGKLTREEVDKMSHIDFFALLIDEYVQYPHKQNSYLRYLNMNYCLLAKVYPFLQPVLSLIC
jgi:hypothetical protein